MVRLKTWAGQREGDQPLVALSEHAALLSLLLGLRGTAPAAHQHAPGGAVGQSLNTWHAPLTVTGQLQLQAGGGDAVAVLHTLTGPRGKVPEPGSGVNPGGDDDDSGWCGRLLSQGGDVFSCREPGAGTMLVAAQDQAAGEGAGSESRLLPRFTTSMADAASHLAALVAQRPALPLAAEALPPPPPHTPSVALARPAAPGTCSLAAGASAFTQLPTAVLEMGADPGAWTLWDMPAPALAAAAAVSGAVATPATAAGLSGLLPAPKWAAPDAAGGACAAAVVPALAVAPRAAPPTKMEESQAAHSNVQSDSTHVVLLALQGVVAAAAQLSAAACAPR